MKKKGLITLFSLFAVVIVGLLVWVIVLASQTQNLNSNISISYTATEISGSVSATYKIGGGEEKNMVVNSNASETVARFDADLDTQMQGLSPTESNIDILFGQDVIFTYTFVNTGGHPYYAALAYTDIDDDDTNIDFYYKQESDSDYVTKKPRYIVVQPQSSAIFKIKLTIHSGAFDAFLSGTFNWNLSKDMPSIVSLSFANNAGSEINPENVSIVFNNDETKFMIVGPTPIVNGTTTNLSELTNSSGSEFYYFASNSEVKDTTGYTDPGTTYHLSPYSSLETSSTKFDKGSFDNNNLINSTNLLQNMTASTSSDPSCYTAKEVWYDTPEDPTIIYATFMTPNNTTGDSSGGANGDVIFSHSVLSIKGAGFRESSSIATAIIPNSVSNIGGSAFSGDGGGDNCSLSNIILPNSVETIGDCAFYDSWISSIIIPDSVTSIGDQVFRKCTRLTSITIPGCVTSLEDFAFESCSSLTSITIPDSLTSIGDSAFQYCSGLTSITIPDSVTSIGSDAFRYCSKNLESITVSSGNTEYSGAGNCLINTSTKKLLLGCKNSIIPTDGSVTSIGSYAFYYCSSLTNITIPDSVTRIGNAAFQNCSSLQSVTIGSGVTSIEDYAFQYCSSLTSVTIGSGVKSIQRWIFDGCSNLTSVTFNNTSGWWYSSSSTATSGTSISSTDLADTSTAATYLKSTYKGYYWKRS